LQHCSKKQTLLRNQFIQKTVAVSMLIVFAFSITPTIVFHNWFANHNDTVRKSGNTTGEQLGKITFNCHCDHIVAESPFTEPGKLVSQPLRVVFAVEQAGTVVQPLTATSIFHSLRGPPVV